MKCFWPLLMISTGLSWGAVPCRADAPKGPEQNDIRLMAPPQPAQAAFPIALPESGSDLSTVGADWARREVHLVSGGADERVLDSANQKLDRLFSSVTEVNASSNEDRASANSTRAPANEGPWLKPRSIHFSRIGEIELGFYGSAKLKCDLAGGGAGWNLSKPLSNDVDLSLHHESDASSLRLRLNW